MKRTAGSLTLFAGFVTVVTPTVGQPELRQKKEIIAVQIRKQGFSCDNPVSAERDLQRSKPNDMVWVLRCGNASYRVRLVPKMAAHVDRID